MHLCHVIILARWLWLNKYLPDENAKNVVVNYKEIGNEETRKDYATPVGKMW